MGGLTERDVLEGAAARVKRGWCQETSARTAPHGGMMRSVDPCDPLARSWCAIGAISAEAPRASGLFDAAVASAASVCRGLLAAERRLLPEHANDEMAVEGFNDSGGRLALEVAAMLTVAAREAGCRPSAPPPLPVGEQCACEDGADADDGER